MRDAKVSRGTHRGDPGSKRGFHERTLEGAWWRTAGPGIDLGGGHETLALPGDPGWRGLDRPGLGNMGDWRDWEWNADAATRDRRRHSKTSNVDTEDSESVCSDWSGWGSMGAWLWEEDTNASRTLQKS